MAGQSAFPNQIVKFALVGFGEFERRGIAGHVCGTDTLMRLLGIFGFVFVYSGRFGHIVRAVPIFNCITRLGHRLGCHINPVGSHIGDVSRLIKALRGAHGLARAHAEFTARLLLQG